MRTAHGEAMTGRGRLLLPWAIPSVAIATMLPELIGGISASDSFRYNIVWTEQFAALVGAGELYPRWLPLAWDGLGAPTFYHYPPLFFWIASLVRMIAPAAIDTGRVASCATLLMLVASGYAMRAWLAQRSPAIPALIGAIGYMLAPYHLYDIHGRGALAEACGYALLPIVMIGIEDVLAGRRRGVPVMAIGYALLLLSHLPTALLASVTIIPAYLGYRLWSRPREAGPLLAIAGLGGVLGIGLAAFYVVPAVVLLPTLSVQAAVGQWYDPVNWSLLTPARWPSDGRMAFTMLFATAAVLAALAGALGGARRNWFWAGLGVILFVMIAGLVPGLWTLPGLAQVQFPSRLLLVAEFVAITALVWSRPAIRHPLTGAAAAAGFLATLLSVTVIMNRVSLAASLGIGAQHEVTKDYRDAPEYLPKGFAIPIEPGKPASPATIVLPPAGWIARAPGAAIEAVATGDGLRVVLDSAAPADVTVRRFAHPRWVLRDDAGRVVPWRATAGERLVGWRAPAGRSGFTLSAETPAIVTRASMVSLACVVILLIALLLARWRGGLSDNARFPG